ncbi:unnamed protein product [Diamesa serratosioi]
MTSIPSSTVFESHSDENKPVLGQLMMNQQTKKRRVSDGSTGSGKMKSVPAVSVARRNARERNRVKQVNNGFSMLRDHIPPEIADTFEVAGRGSAKKLSKVETLRMAVEYIRSLEKMLSFESNTSPSPPPPLLQQQQQQHHHHHQNIQPLSLNLLNSSTLNFVNNIQHSNLINSTTSSGPILKATTTTTPLRIITPAGSISPSSFNQILISCPDESQYDNIMLKQEIIDDEAIFDETSLSNENIIDALSWWHEQQQNINHNIAP